MLCQHIFGRIWILLIMKQFSSSFLHTPLAFCQYTIKLICLELKITRQAIGPNIQRHRVLISEHERGGVKMANKSETDYSGSTGNYSRPETIFIQN